MDQKTKDKIPKVIGAKNAQDIMKFIGDHSETQYKDLKEFVTTGTLNTRLRELLSADLIQYHFERVKKRRGWYSITDTGEKVLQHLKKIEEVEPERGEELVRLFSLDHTQAILDFIQKHGKTQYKDMMDSFNTHTLNIRLRDLLVLELINHHVERLEKRREWYEITEKGNVVLQYMRDFAHFMEESSTF